MRCIVVVCVPNCTLPGGHGVIRDLDLLLDGWETIHLCVV